MLTDTALRRLKPRASPYRVFEQGEIPGFGVAVSPGGAKTFFLQHTRDGTRRFYSLGTYPAVGLALARERARETLATLARGEDPRSPKPATAGTVEQLLSAWIAHQRGAGALGRGTGGASLWRKCHPAAPAKTRASVNLRSGTGD